MIDAPAGIFGTSACTSTSNARTFSANVKSKCRPAQLLERAVHAGGGREHQHVELLETRADRGEQFVAALVGGDVGA